MNKIINYALNKLNNTKKIGILGGGQLGKMLIQAAHDFDFHIAVLDPDENAPCRLIAHEFTLGQLTDYQTVVDFGSKVDVITIEIERVNIEALESLEKMGKKVFPQPSVLRKIQDKRIQKQFYADNDIPTADFILTDSKADVLVNAAFLPAVNKLGKDGYDGKGVQILRTETDFEKAFEAPSLLEKLIDFDKEIAVIVARNESGEIKTFPTVEMLFHPEANLVELLFSPAQISKKIDEQAQKIALDVAQKMGIVGLLAVEMFVTKMSEILVNEVAPRPHNSGHQTIKANDVSQYEQHLRAIMNLPLGHTSSNCHAAMVNILGEANHEGEAVYENMDEILKLEGVHPFLYGKKVTKPFRKMGHVTIIAKNFETLLEKANFVKSKLKVVSLES